MKDKASKIFCTVYFACIISCILLSCYLLSGVWGRYFSKTEGSDSARAAKWDVSVIASPNNASSFEFSKDTPNTDTWELTVVSKSEVALEYDIILTLPSALPDNSPVDFKIDNEITPTVEDLTYTFKNAGAFSAAGGSQTHELTITVNDFGTCVDLNGITVKVVARQND